MANASLGRRIGAIIYDGLLVMALMFLGTLPFIASRDGEPVAPGEFWYQIVMFAIAYSFFVGFWTIHGRTLGMQSWGLRIETPEGGRPRLHAATVRFVAALLSWIPLGFGFWWQLWDRENLSWHDRVSKTRINYYPRA